MTTAVYPGSFNPWHKGHEDILRKSLRVFDEVIIAVGINPDKINILPSVTHIVDKDIQTKVQILYFEGLLVDFATEKKVDAVIRGLRNGHDLQYEMNQQYWNEDLGLEMPIVYFICDRTLSHISSSAIRALKKVKK